MTLPQSLVCFTLRDPPVLGPYIIFPAIGLGAILILSCIVAAVSKVGSRGVAVLDFKTSPLRKAPPAGTSLYENKTSAGGITSIFLFVVFALFAISLIYQTANPKSVSFDTYSEDPTEDRHVATKWAVLVTPCSKASLPGGSPICPYNLTGTIPGWTDFNCTEVKSRSQTSSCLLEWKQSGDWSIDEVNGVDSISYQLQGVVPAGLTQAQLRTYLRDIQIIDLQNKPLPHMIRMKFLSIPYNNITNKYMTSVYQLEFVQSKAFPTAQFCGSSRAKVFPSLTVDLESEYRVLCEQQTSLTGAVLTPLCASSAGGIKEAVFTPTDTSNMTLAEQADSFGITFNLAMDADNTIYLYTRENVQSLLSVLFSVAGACASAHPIIRLVMGLPSKKRRRTHEVEAASTGNEMNGPV